MSRRSRSIRTIQCSFPRANTVAPARRSSTQALFGPQLSSMGILTLAPCIRLPRSKHCSVCNHCVARFDHQYVSRSCRWSGDVVSALTRVFLLVAVRRLLSTAATIDDSLTLAVSCAQSGLTAALVRGTTSSSCSSSWYACCSLSPRRSFVSDRSLLLFMLVADPTGTVLLRLRASLERVPDPRTSCFDRVGACLFNLTH